MQTFWMNLGPCIIAGAYVWAAADPQVPQSLRRWDYPARRWHALAAGLAVLWAALSWTGLGMAQGRVIFQAAFLPLLLCGGRLWAARASWPNAGACCPSGLRSFPWAWVTGWWLAFAAGTLALTALFPQPAPQGLPPGLEQMAPPVRWAWAGAVLAVAPILEETLFRHFLLYRLAGILKNWGPWGSIIACSLLWAATHSASGLEPGWLKFAQIFLMGLALGWTAWLKGLGAAIAVHLAYNLSLAVILA